VIHRPIILDWIGREIYKKDLLGNDVGQNLCAENGTWSMDMLKYDSIDEYV
jgi:hypothetical protein